MIDINLIKRNTVEIVTGDELSRLLGEKKSPVTYCGYEVSGPVHIGTLVAVYKQIDFMNAGLGVKVLFADVHTELNRKGDKEWVDSMVAYWMDCLRALGLNKPGVEFIRGSEFEFERDYIKDVFTLGLKSTLNRALRSMQEIARDVEHARVSQVFYPLMQIADIKALGVDIAHGGMEQRKIHMLARELLPEIDYQKPVCIHTPLLCSLQGPESKMSSSKPETMIRVDDEPDKITEKIRKAYCPLEKEGNPVLQICEYLIFPKLGGIEVRRKEKFGGNLVLNSYPELEKEYLEGRLHPMDLKTAVTENLIAILEPVREKVGE
ncbi:MAG: tyrosine--tRNA ligase [Candidatus Altiarchaeota archaeon]|nr:tyrosine--tRNA ligase [Candidatus Altiarchaeota archaeon]